LNQIKSNQTTIITSLVVLFLHFYETNSKSKRDVEEVIGSTNDGVWMVFGFVSGSRKRERSQEMHIWLFVFLFLLTLILTMCCLEI